MFTLSLLTALAALNLANAQVIAPDANVPEGFQVGYASVSILETALTSTFRSTLPLPNIH